MMPQEPRAIRIDLGRSWLEPPAVATHATLRLCSGFFFVLGGLLLVVGTPFLDGDQVDRTGLGIEGACALVVGLVFFRVGHRIPRPAYLGINLLGSLLITLAVWLGHAGPATISLTAPFLFPVVASTLLFALREAVPLVVVTEGLCATAMGWTGSSVGDVIVVEGCTLGMAVVVGCLARVADAAEEDPLTGLLNRRGFDRRLDEHLRRTDREGGQLSLAVLDLDYFKRINDSRGHQSGDRLLASCARSWRDFLPEGAVLSRYGGDEFLLLLPDTPLGRAADLADELRAVAPVTVSAGVAGWQHGDSGSVLLNRADVALYEAKTTGRDHTVVYGDPAREASELEAAIAKGELRLYLQPIYQFSTDSIIGFEGLVRWQHPVKGLIGPEEFVPQAERTGAINSLGAWVLGETCRLAMTLPGPRRSIGVNASANELRSHEYAAQVRQTLQRWSMPGDLLILEVTETAFDDDDPQVEQTLREIRALGALVAIDDFGSGYSSLRRIEHLPIDLIKVDGALIQSITEDRDDAPILEAIVTMGRSLGVKLVAEHVETPHQMAVLRELGYDLAQGYLFGRPTDPSQPG
jgi:diguanylate cyclase